MYGRTLWKSTDELIKELFRTDLEVERVTAVFHTDVEEL